MKISFNFLATVNLPHRQKLKSFIASIFKKEKKKLSRLTFVFCPDDYLLEINKTYLGHDYFTDIISFNLSDPGSENIDGEIYISVDTIKDNAKRFNASISKELHRVIFHGILHLCGYDDKSAKEKEIMTLKEDYWLDLYFNVPRATSKFI